ncbi:2-hydroxychromene-2-carboxylate isomerase [Motiliproteus sp. SC1-56]|uniref:2-hydroxychromene-2-carboxylate isomerase n=1 Tax=Motiliproteus sp. SC1-56 TaxID=2799565 RepID=UPI001A8E52E5|nr:2-hydroxychromene-2-carboxylate isomerase [Motiliproteus sp. SC1-56]
MRRQIEFFYDILSPYSYLAHCRLPGIARRSQAELVLRPVSLPRLLEGAGNTPPPTVPARFAYAKTDVQALARYYGIPLVWPEHFPARTGRAMSLLTLLEGEERATFTKRLFEAYWIEGQDPGNPEVLEALVGAERVERAAEPEVRERLAACTQEALQRGAFGVPTCFVGERMFFGNDRLFLIQGAFNEEE